MKRDRGLGERNALVRLRFRRAAAFFYTNRSFSVGCRNQAPRDWHRRGRDTGGCAPVRVLAYVRVSSEEQADSRAGLEAQREAIQRECERRGWHVVAVIEDAGYSAKDLKRPGVCAALQQLERKSADAL